MSKDSVRWRIDPARTAIVVVDMQRVFCDPAGVIFVPDTQAIVAPIATLVETGRAAGLPIVYLRHVVRGDGSDTGRMRDLYPDVDGLLARDNPFVEVIDSLAPKPGDIVVDKLFYSGFHNTDLDTVLRSRDVDTIVVCGTVSNVCCDTTVRDAVHREYKVIALDDACAAMPYPDMGWGALSASDVHRVTMTTIAHEFGEVTTVADIVARIAAAAKPGLHAVA